MPTLSSSRNIHAARPTFDAVGSTDLLMLAGGGIAAHPDGPAAGVRSLRQAWDAAIAGVPLADAPQQGSEHGDHALTHAMDTFAAEA